MKAFSPDIRHEQARRWLRRVMVLAGVTIAVALYVAGTAQGTGTVSLIASNQTGYGWSASISNDGRHVAYSENPGDKVERKDYKSGETYLASTDADGNPVDGYQGTFGDVGISGDGRYVTFASHAVDLVPDDVNGVIDVFIKDAWTGAVRVASTNSSGEQANGVSMGPFISGDGRFIVFHSQATNLVPGDTNGLLDVFIKDTLTEDIRLVSSSSGGEQANGYSVSNDISADGRFVAFQSHASNLVPGDVNGGSDMFVKDTQSGNVTMVSTDSNGAQLAGNGSGAVISDDGNFAAFAQLGSVYLKNVQSGATTTINSSGNGSSITANGRYVAYSSGRNVFVHDAQTGAETMIENPVPSDPGAYMYSPRISGDGRYVAFTWDGTFENSQHRMLFLAATPICEDSKPFLTIAKSNIYWGSYDDYINRRLSIDYSVSNFGTSTAYGTTIVGSSNTQGVSLAWTPGIVGDIPMSTSKPVTLTYNVPSGVTAFSAQIYATARGVCGHEYSFPAPFPGQ